MKSIQNIINKFKVKNLSVITLPLFMIIIMLPKQANANAWELLWNPLATLGDATFGAAINNLTGWLKATLLEILNSAIVPLVTNVMSYQNFFSTGVNAGWDITRNFANLFFALILLLIAIATVLNLSALSNYNAKNMLPKFIFVALFINFSKAIVGFLIDISQIIMITLYNSFGPSMKDIITNASKLAEAGAESNTENSTLNIFTIVLIAILAFVLLWTAVALAVRIVTLWFVIMFSPLAFMAQLVPGLQGLTSDWSKQLQSSLVNGPTLMFLLYLAFSVMKNGMLANPSSSGGNIMTNGNLINYVLTIGLLFTANTTASKASEAAPSIVKNAVGVAGTVATFGLGAYVGAGGYNTNQLRKKTIELGDKGIGGVTRGVQIASGGKINPNDRYEMMKQRGKERTEKGQGVENIPFIGSRIKDSRAGKWMSSVAQQTLGGEAGRKANFENTLDNLAEEANRNGTLDNNPTLARAYANKIASETKKITEEDSSVPELIEKLKKTVDSATGKAIMMRITQLEGLDELLEDRDFKKYAEIHENRSEQINALIQDKFETNPGESTPRTRSRQDKAFRSRIEQVAKNKNQGAFFSNDSRSKVEDLSITEMGQALKTNRSAFEIRSKDATTGAFEFNGNKAKYQLDISIIDNAILKGDVRLLEDPKTWAPYKEPDKEEIRNYIKDKISSRGISSGDIYKRYTKALQGLGN